ALLEDTGMTGEWIGIFVKSKPLVAAYGAPRSLRPRPASKPAHGGVTECAGAGSREERFDGVRAETRRGAFIGSTFGANSAVPPDYRNDSGPRNHCSLTRRSKEEVGSVAGRRKSSAKTQLA